ncbi:MAG TPA: tetratricopeptide repeat protein, partial [Candidatus Goldiibacteriota bacterium]|nr:tetratricopeptide repeat protein [Candidatus Goldiibacteriota bacterium]
FSAEIDDPYSFENPPAGSENVNAGTGEPPLADKPGSEDMLLPAMEQSTSMEQQGTAPNPQAGGVKVAQPEPTQVPVSKQEEMFKGEISIEQKEMTREQIEKDIADLYKEGKKYFDNEDYEAAAEIWQRIIENYPVSRSLYNVRYSLATAYEYSRQYEKAIDQYQKTLGEKPKSEVALEASYRLAGCYAKLQKWPYSIEIYRDIIRKAPTNKETIRAYFNIANIYFKMEKLKKVNNILLSIVKNYPNSEYEIQARFQLASIYAQTGRYKSSINEYKLIKHKFKNTEWAPRAAMHIGDTLKLAGDLKGAKDAYSRVMYEYYNRDDYVQLAEQRITDLKKYKEYEQKFYGAQ